MYIVKASGMFYNQSDSTLWIYFLRRLFMIDRANVPNVQVSIVQKLDNAVSIQWIMLLVSLILIRWKVIYPFHSALQLLNNRGEKFPLNMVRSGEDCLLPPQGFCLWAKSRGGTLLARAYIKDSTYSSNKQSVY